MTGGRALAGIALNTIRETFRQPFYFLLMGVTIAALLVALLFPFFTFGYDTDMYKDLGLSFILVFMLVAGVTAAATGVAREVEDRTAQTILSKALGRWQFVVGKYLGVLAAVGVAIALVGVVFAAAVYYYVALDAARGGGRGVPMGIGYEVEAFRALQWNQALTVTPGIVLVFLQVAVISALATALSTRLSVLASVAVSLAMFVIGHLTVFLEGGMRAADETVRGLTWGLLAAVPFLEIFNLNQKLSHTVLAPLEVGTPGAAAWSAVWGYVGWASLYALAYVGFAVGLGVVLFRRRALG